MLIFPSNSSRREQRTLHRRAGGHLRGDSTNLSTVELNATVGDSKNSNSQIKFHKSYFRRKTTSLPFKRDAVKKDEKVINVTILDTSKESDEDENSLDYGLMSFSAAGEGKRSESETKDVKKDESKKTLADQIAEGKYGLIEDELFKKTPKAPGIISYKLNPETPNDNEKTLGGLSKDEIWLAEDHLLVLKGGVTNSKKNNENENDWSPIDDYEAPKRPVKIPLNPRVPPPFPVQLKENGPIQFIGANQFSLFNPYTNETGLFTNVDGHIAPYISSTASEDRKNSPSGAGAIKNFTKTPLHEVNASPPWIFNVKPQDDLLKKFPFNLPLPDQVLNRTEDFDEDDPSLFYPPPYSFVYKSNYTNLAPVGPLVPGIILPPPPDFFSLYNPEEEKKPIKTPLDAYKRIKEIQLKNRLSATSTSSTTPKSTNSGYIRDFTRKTKIPVSTTTVTPTKIFKTRLTTSMRPTTILETTTAAPEFSKFKTHHIDTTTLRLHPVYVPTVKIQTTTKSPEPEVPLKQYQKDYGTQAHPIYFEYFDARTANPFVGPGYEYNPPASPLTTTTSVPPFSEPPRAQKKPKQFYPPQFISSTISSSNVDANFLFVTQKPEILGTILSPQGYSTSTESPSYNTAIPIQKPLLLKPVYDDEISAIKQTLDYYKSGSKKQKPHHKVKAVYEFSFEATRHKSQEEFEPIVGYSHPANPSNTKYSNYDELINANNYLPSTTENSVKYYRTKQSATLPPKNIDGSPTAYGQKLRQQQSLNYHIRPIFKEVVTSPQQSKAQKIIVYPTLGHEPQPQSVTSGYRINSKNVKYKNQQQQYYGPASEVVSLLNDTLVNYKQPQRPINPFSESIDVSRYPSNRPVQNNPPIYFAPPQSYPTFFHPPPPPQSPYPIYPQRPVNQHRQPSQYYQQQQHNPFDYPLISQINPESVHITFYNRPMDKSDERF